MQCSEPTLLTLHYHLNELPSSFSRLFTMLRTMARLSSFPPKDKHHNQHLFFLRGKLLYLNMFAGNNVQKCIHIWAAHKGGQCRVGNRVDCTR